MNRRAALTRSLIILLVILVPLFALVLAGQSFIRDAVILPLEYTFWLAGLAIRAVPQSIYWGILCGAAFFLIIFSLASGGRSPAAPREETSTHAGRERVAFWARQLSIAPHGDYLRLRFADHFGRLIIDILVNSGRLPPEQYLQALENGDLGLPAPLLDFLKIRLTPLYALVPGSFKERLAQRWQWLRDGFSRRRANDKAETFKRDVSEVVAYLENDLEVSSRHDGY